MHGEGSMSTALQPFQPSRADGRSDRQVVYEMMQDAEPNTVFDFDRIADALQVGVAETVTHQRACSAARAANRTLLREKQRSVTVVRGLGYRVIAANEHMGVAVTRRRRAESQIRAGIGMLRGCRLDELSEPQRTLHEGQLLVMSGVYEAVKHVNSRQDRQEKVIDRLKRRVDRLEAPVS